jgi:hypothetical protein
MLEDEGRLLEDDAMTAEALRDHPFAQRSIHRAKCSA